MDRRPLWFCAGLAPLLIWSAIRPHDYFTWWLEVAPIFIGFPVAMAFRKRFPLSNLLVLLLWLHAVILLVGGHYTYARVPLGNWAMQWFGWTRNNYDKLGHFAQGFVPAIIAREILLRTSPLARAVTSLAAPAAAAAAGPSRWLPFLVVCVCLAISAVYELIEWLTAVASGGAATDFLGTQGDPWDTQTDMAMALVGATLAMVAMTRLHDRSLAKLGV